MRIAFLCGSQELGRDGVGDYAACLAGELRSQGHEVMVVGLRDRFASEIIATERPGPGGSVQTLRLPSALSWTACIEVTRQHLDRFAPDWVSLQFVCYTFHRKGLVFGLAGKLAPLLTGRKLHIMFHELWIGAWLGAGWKKRFVGAVQGHLIRTMVHKLAPKVIHTSNPAYAGMLARFGIKADVLPLFANLDVEADPGSHEVRQIFRQHGVDLSAPARDALWIGAIFGAIHPEWKPERFFDELALSAEREGKTVVVVGIGRFGAAGDRIWAETARSYADRFRFVLLGPQPSETISRVFQAADFGISTTPWALFGKSSTGIAMRDHGLPVVVTRDDWRPRVATPIDSGDCPLVVRYTAGMANHFGEFLGRRRPPASTRPGVVRTFLDALAQG